MKYSDKFLLIGFLFFTFISLSQETDVLSPTTNNLPIEIDTTIPITHGLNNQVKEAQPFCASSLLFNTSNITKRQDYDQQIYNRYLTKEFAKNNSDDTTIYKIPVAIHIVHENGEENISNGDIFDAIDLLNKSFRNQAPFHTTIGADIHVEFCLSLNGITRHVSPLTNMYVDNGVDDIALKQLELMDPTKYINIWVVKSITSVSMGPGVAAYATFPFKHGDADDGIVIEAEWIKNDPDGVKILAHEIGHYFGLYHTFQEGCQNNNCMLQGDRICDTPPDNSTASDCSGIANSCLTDEDDASSQNPFRNVALGGLGDQPDMVENYMDYGDLTCKNQFTSGQRERMRDGLLETRYSLLENASSLCTDCNVYTPISVNLPDSLLSGVTHTFTVEAGDTIGMNYLWVIEGIPGMAFMEQSVTYTSDISTITPVMVIVYNDSLGCSSTYRDTIHFYCPVEEPIILVDHEGPYSPGEVVVFSTEDNGLNYSWHIDGMPMQQGPSFTYTVTSLGRLLRLTATDTICASTTEPLYIDPNNCSGSKENNTWHFGNGAGIDFNVKPPISVEGTFIDGTSHNNIEGCAIYCDENGQPLYASNGSSVWEVQTGENLANGGDDLKGYSHSTQSALFVPVPNSNLIYLFTVEAQAGMTASPTDGGLYYSIIDRTTNELTVRNQLLAAPMTEKVTAVKNLRGNGVWIIGHKYGSNEFYAWTISGSGISSNPIISAVGTNHFSSSLNLNDATLTTTGQMVTSPSGKKLALAVSSLNLIEVFDFNNITGTVSNPVTYTVPIEEEPYGVAFSPDERFVYGCNSNLGDQQLKTYRWDLSLGDTATRVIIGTGKNSARGSLQLAPDGKIYGAYAIAGTTFLRVIANPNAVNVNDCGFQKNGFKLEYGSLGFGLPNPVQSAVVNNDPKIIGLDKVCISGNPHTESYFFYPVGNSTYSWIHSGANASSITNDSTLMVTFSQPGIDTLVLQRHTYCGDSFDTLYITSDFPLTDFTIGSDITVCKETSVVLDAGEGMYSYDWSNGKETPTASYNNAGKAWVDVLTPAGCILTDTIMISYYSIPEYDLGNDTSLCNGESITLVGPSDVDSYLWNTGSTSQSIVVADSGNYILNVTKYGCTFEYSRIIQQGIILNFFDNDTIYPSCNELNTEISLPLGYDNYLWEMPNDSIVTTSNITMRFDIPGWYKASYFNTCGSETDSVYYHVERLTTLDSIVTCTDTAIAIINHVITHAVLTPFGGAMPFEVSNGNGYVQVGDTVKFYADGVYLLIGQINSCIVAQNITVFVNSTLPSNNDIEVDLGPDITMCSGGIITLNAGNSFESYQWSTGWHEQTLTAYQPGIYWVDAMYCNEIYSDTIVIHQVSSKPQIIGDTVLCEDEINLLTVLPDGGTYIWEVNGGEISTGNENELIVQQGGTYRVKNTTCDNTEWSNILQVVEINCGSGINDNESVKEITISPNPSAGVFDLSQSADIEIRNSVGQLIFVNKSVSSFDLSSFASGIYFVTLKNQEKVLLISRVLKK